VAKKKRKYNKAKPTKRRKSTASSDAAGGHDVKSRRKYDRGGRVEAYTMGEALGSKNWP